MRKWTNSVPGLLVLLLSVLGCATRFTRPDFDRISVGMTKAEVIGQLGRPTMTAAQQGVEYLQYEWDHPADGRWGGHWYFLRLVSGRVDSYGQKGDFNTTKDPTVNMNVDQTIRHR